MVLVVGNNNLPLCNQTADFLRVHAFLFRHNFHLRCDDTLSCRVHLCCVHIRFLLVHVAPNFAALLFFCVGLWCMQPAAEGSNPHPWTIKKLHYAKNIAQLPRVNSMSLRWHYPNQVMGQSMIAYSQPTYASSPFLKFFLIITSLLLSVKGGGCSFFQAFLSACAFINLLLRQGEGGLLKAPALRSSRSFHPR